MSVGGSKPRFLIYIKVILIHLYSVICRVKSVILYYRYFGCGLVIPEKLEGCKVLDLGSGSGRDCYVLSKLVGERGQVTGLDMTDEMVRHRSNILTHFL